MEAQRYPDDFDGIVAGAPVFDYQRLNITHVWMAQRMFADNLAGNLAFDKDGDGMLESLTKLRILQQAVLAKCDANDGIRDGVIDDPPSCRFDPVVDLKPRMCPGGTNGDDCFTQRQLQTLQESIADRTTVAESVSTREWTLGRVGMAADDVPASRQRDGAGKAHIRRGPCELSLLREVTGRPAANPFNPRQIPDKRANPPEFGWWEFNIDDVTSGRGAAMMAITDATDPDLSRFLLRKNGKLLMFHGWADPEGQAEPTLTTTGR